MQRIVDGILFEGKVVPGAFDVATWRANGVLERSVRPVYEWSELGPVPALDEPDPERDAEWLEEKRQQSLRKAAQRAKQVCRRTIIAEGFDELLTITTRAVYDAVTFKRYFKEWVRRMRRALGGEFRYCAGFEPQERGAYHAHVACFKLPKHAQHKGVRVPGWRLGTEIWRAIVGADNGLVFVGGKGKHGLPRRQGFTLAKMAAYVSKYIMKDYDKLPPGMNRYSCSDGEPLSNEEQDEYRKQGLRVPRARSVLPPVERIRLTGCTFAEAIAVTFELAEFDEVVSHRVSRWGDSVWLCTEKRRGTPPPLMKVSHQ